MFILPYRENLDSNNEAEGISVSAISKPCLFLSGLLACLAMSTTYHSFLYGYSIPNWAIPVFICSLIPFGLRIRLLVSGDKMLSIKQWALYGIKLREIVFHDERFSTFSFENTGCINTQKYWVLNGESTRVSLHISKVSSKHISYLSAKISSYTGLKK